MGELQINNLPIIIISFIIICIGVLAYLEIRKLDAKFNLIINRLDDINSKCNKEINVPNNMELPNIDNDLEKKIQIQLPEMNRSVNQEIDQEIIYQRENYNNEYNNEEYNNEEINHNMEENYDYNENKEIEEELENNEERFEEEYTSESIDDEEDNHNGIEEIVDDDDDDNLSDGTEMTIEMNNKFKDLSVRELKELCNQNDLKVSGNKTTLINRLLSLENN